MIDSETPSLYGFAMATEDQAQAEIHPMTAEETPGASAPEAPASETHNADALPVETTPRGEVLGVEAYNELLAQANAPEPESVQAGDQTPQDGDQDPDDGKPPQDTPPDGDQDPDEEVQKQEQDPDPDAGKNFRPRLTNLDARTKQAIMLVKEFKDQGKDISLAEAERRVNALYGVEDSAPQSPEGKAPEDQAPERTAETIDAEIAEKQARAEQAADELDVKTARALDREITKLELEKIRLEQKSEQAGKAEEVKFQEGVARSTERAREIYPASTDPAHPIHAKATEIWEALKGTGNPLINDQDAPFKVYQMAANEMGIAPLSKATPASPKAPTSSTTPKPQPVHQQAVRQPKTAIPVASATSRTTQQGPAEPDFGNIRTAYDYEQIARTMGANL